MFRLAWRWFQSALFPVYCISCRREGEWWCPACRVAVEPKQIDFQADSSLDSLVYLYTYQADSQIGQLIRAFKYHHTAALVELWQELIKINRFIYNNPVIIPVPLFAARERDRDYNQAALIGKIIAEKYGLPIQLASLQRIKNTKQQAKLGKKERQNNVSDAFAWTDGVTPREVLLVDDVFTTGATMQACATVLKKQGVEIVHGFTLAAGV